MIRDYYLFMIFVHDIRIYGIQTTSHIDTNNNDSLAHRQTHFTIYFYGELITLSLFNRFNWKKWANEWKSLTIHFIWTYLLVHDSNTDGKQFLSHCYQCLFIPHIHFPCSLARSSARSLSLALKRIDVFASHVTRRENSSHAFDYRRVSFAVKSKFFPQLTKAPKSLHLKVIHLFPFTLSKHNTHNPIRLFANDNNVSCSNNVCEHFSLFSRGCFKIEGLFLIADDSSIDFLRKRWFDTKWQFILVDLNNNKIC